ncbi:MAG TPA: hypothetical protein VF546_04650 [Pyrinomonadaceae bacterium]|jgi:hypothetical protein
MDNISLQLPPAVESYLIALIYRNKHKLFRLPIPELPKKMKLSDARRYLGVSFTKLTALVHSGELPYEISILDGRVKLVRRAHLDALKRRAARR